MLKIAIIDDNAAELKFLQTKIAQTALSFDVHYEYECFLAIDDSFYEKEFDLYFIDVVLGENPGGFNLAQKITAAFPNAKIIFCSNYENLVFKSFQYSPFFFLRKSSLDEDLASAFHQILTLKQLTSFCFDQMEICAFKDILYVEKRQNYLNIYKTDQTKLNIRCSLVDVEKDFLDHHFLKINQGTLVNTTYIVNITDRHVELSYQIVLSVSARRWKEVKTYYLNHYNRR